MADTVAVVSGDLTWLCFAKPALWLPLLCVCCISVLYVIQMLYVISPW